MSLLPILVRKHKTGDVYYILFPTLGLATCPDLQCLRCTLVPQFSSCGTKDTTAVYFESVNLKQCIKATKHQPHFSRVITPYLSAITYLFENFASTVSSPLKEVLNNLVAELLLLENPLQLSAVRNLSPKLEGKADAHACALTTSYVGLLAYFTIANSVLTAKARPKTLESSLTATQKKCLAASYPTKLCLLVPAGLGKSNPRHILPTEDFI